ncbi:LPXTG cell wall anchor domain-containing protein [Streptomyces sp. NPDC001691]|uniref:LPXTG cell wall anchor domain-containing protein n=1 Tax=unclassified Streptomyces TaxID=2593676 RepID=UPI0011C048AB|nr:LPXTG cell wall anchor domain-containing protein [Streptomyces sp. SDr-06]
MTVPQHRPTRPASRGPRRLAGAAATTGLLLALAVPALAGTAHADGPSARPQPAGPAKAAAPGTASSPVKRASGSEQAARPQAAPSAAPSTGAESGTAPRPAAGTGAPAAEPAPSDQKELAHTGSSTTNAVMGAGAGALILAGAGTVYAVRRRQQH